MVDKSKLYCPIKWILGLDLDALCFLSSYFHSVIFILPSPFPSHLIFCARVLIFFLWPCHCDTGTAGSVPDCFLWGGWVFSNYYSDVMENPFLTVLSFVGFSLVLKKIRFPVLLFASVSLFLPLCLFFFFFFAILLPLFKGSLIKSIFIFLSDVQIFHLFHTFSSSYI